MMALPTTPIRKQKKKTKNKKSNLHGKFQNKGKG